MSFTDKLTNVRRDRRVDECSPYLELPCRSLEHVLREREAASRGCATTHAGLATYPEQLAELRARVARLQVPASIGASLYSLHHR